jgi:putative transposase
LLLRSYDAGQIILQDLASKECRQTTDGALLQAIFSGQVLCQDAALQKAGSELGMDAVVRLQARGATEGAILHACAKLQWITALSARGIDRIVNKPYVRTAITNLASGELKDLKRFSVSTLYEAELTLRKNGGDVCSLVPEYDMRGGRGRRRISDRALDVLSTDVQARLEDESKPPIRASEVWNDVNVKINEINNASPERIEQISESTVRRYVAAVVPADELAVRRLGKKAALKMFRTNSGARDTATRPLEMSEYDDVDAAVFLTDERNGLPWGRAFITNGADQCCWIVLGYDLSDKPRDYYSAVNAVCDSLRPKADCQPGEMGYGAQGGMLLDNASYNAGRAMRHRSHTHKLLMSMAKPFASTEKTCIEHLNHVIKDDFCPTLPGWRGRKRDAEGLKRGMATAVLTLQQFHVLYRTWVRTVYANKPGEDGLTPKQRWLMHYSKHAPAVRYSEEQLAMFRLRPIELKFRDSGGLLRLRLRYDCDELARLRRHIGAKANVMVYVDPEDLARVYVLNPLTNVLFPVPTTEDLNYVSTVNERQHRLILALQRTRKKNNPSMKELRDGRAELAKLVEDARDSHKLLERRRARRAGFDGDAASDAVETKITQPTSAQDLILVTELESEILQLQEVDLAGVDEW